MIDSLQNAAVIVAEKKAVLESAFEAGYAVAGQLRTGFAMLLPRDKLSSDLSTRIKTCSDLSARVSEVMRTTGSASLIELSKDCASMLDGLSMDFDAQKDREDTVSAEIKAAQKMASRPLGTLVSLMQAGDAFDQRLTHVIDAVAEVPGLSHETAATVAVVLNAQIDAVGGKLTETRSQMRIALDTLVDLLVRTSDKCAAIFPRVETPVGPDALPARLTALAAAIGDDHKDLAADLLDAAEMVAAARSAPQGCEAAVEEIKRRVETLVAAIDGWNDTDAVLSQINHALGQAQEIFSRCLPASGEDLVDDSDLAFLIDSYTMDEERSIHAHAIAQAKAVTAERMRRHG